MELIILGSDDFDAAVAAAYGWVNRALPDAELGDFVDTLARRIASFDKPALSEAKRLINRRTLPSAAGLIEPKTSSSTRSHGRPSPSAAPGSVAGPSKVGPEFELRFGHYLADLGDDGA